MRVAIVVPNGDAKRFRGDTGYQLATRLARIRRDWSVDLLVPPPVNGAWVKPPGVRLVEVPALRARGLYLASFSLRLCRLLRHYDIVVFLSAAVGLAPLLAPVKPPSKLVLYEWEPWWLLQLYHKRWSRSLARVVRRLEYLTAKRADAIIVVHPLMLRVLSPGDKPARELAEKPILILPQGVSLEDVRRPGDEDIQKAREEMGGGDPLLAFIGMLHPLAAPWDPLLLLREVVEAGYREARLAYIGDGSAAPLVKRLASKLGLEKHVSMLGFKPPSLVPAYLYAADILLSPGLPGYYERTGLIPTKLLTYMAAGRASIAPPWILVPDDVVVKTVFERPSERVYELISSERSRRVLGERARRYVKEHHDYNRLAYRLAAFLEKLV